MKLKDRSIIVTLRRHGYKLTTQRRAVIHAISSSQDHLTPTAVFEKVSQDHPGIGLVTVYRTLKLLADLDLICELHTGDNCPSYTASTPQHHHHLICSGCGKVVDFTSSNTVRHSLSTLEARLSHESGFRIDDHVLEFSGLCQGCQERPSPSV
jgi:Fur family ferric uptake transcriptional regulator